MSDGGPPPTNRGRVALVLPGGGARGAYEVGALSVLLPALEARGERVSLVCEADVADVADVERWPHPHRRRGRSADRAVRRARRRVALTARVRRPSRRRRLA
ncbi:MAG TPA: hypothetical protein VKB03_05620 [Conexibacter sp.]|nr:hypothetical protein [Conexibacter sp.]